MKKQVEIDAEEGPACPKCKSRLMRRIGREGFLETRVYPKLGLYPWECPICRSRVVLKRRGTRVRRKLEASKGLSVSSASGD